MTKDLSFNTTQIEIKAWNKIYSIFTEVDLFKWISSVQAAFIALISVVSFKFGWNFLKKKNDQFNKLNKRFDKLETRFDKQEARLNDLEEDVKSGKRHETKHSKQQVNLLNKIITKLDDKHPEIFNELIE